MNFAEADKLLMVRIVDILLLPLLLTCLLRTWLAYQPLKNLPNSWFAKEKVVVVRDVCAVVHLVSWGKTRHVSRSFGDFDSSHQSISWWVKYCFGKVSFKYSSNSWFLIIYFSGKRHLWKRWLCIWILREWRTNGSRKPSWWWADILCGEDPVSSLLLLLLMLHFKGSFMVIRRVSD